MDLTACFIVDIEVSTPTENSTLGKHSYTIHYDICHKITLHCSKIHSSKRENFAFNDCWKHLQFTNQFCDFLASEVIKFVFENHVVWSVLKVSFSSRYFPVLVVCERTWEYNWPVPAQCVRNQVWALNSQFPSLFADYNHDRWCA